MKYILAIDQGTTSTTAFLYDSEGRIAARSSKEFSQMYPEPGWVEHDPMEIWRTVVDTVSDVCCQYPGSVAAVGITNQRETTVVWNKTTGEPVCNAIVWQCRRTAGLCHELEKHSPLITEKTGLPLDAYFSGTKIRYILDHTNDHTDLLFGTIDTWLIYKLTGGTVHATDYTNASRTMLCNISTMQWDDELCNIVGVPCDMLPEIRKSSDYYGDVVSIDAIRGVPVCGVAGDQQAALFGQNCIAPGQVKNTYGTGCFAVFNTGTEYIRSKNGLLSTLAADADGNPCYALEGSIFVAGAAVQWLRDELGIIQHASETEDMARATGDDNAGVYLVPAFVGLGAPHWDMDARGIFTGITRGSNRNHLARAVLESMAYQSLDVIRAMETETGSCVEELAVDGGAAANSWLMQFQSDILGIPVRRPSVIESTSLGAAFLAGLQSGFWSGPSDIAALKQHDTVFTPDMSKARRDEYLAGWQKALRQARTR